MLSPQQLPPRHLHFVCLSESLAVGWALTLPVPYIPGTHSFNPSPSQVVKNVTQTQDADHAHIRVTFNFNGTAYEPYQKFAASCVFLKELSFRCEQFWWKEGAGTGAGCCWSAFWALDNRPQNTLAVGGS